VPVDHRKSAAPRCILSLRIVILPSCRSAIMPTCRSWRRIFAGTDVRPRWTATPDERAPFQSWSFLHPFLAGALVPKSRRRRGRCPLSFWKPITKPMPVSTSSSARQASPSQGPVLPRFRAIFATSRRPALRQSPQIALTEQSACARRRLR
jgi:hypothetical protein